MSEFSQKIGKKEEPEFSFAAFAAGFAVGTGLIVTLEQKFPQHRYQTIAPLPLRYKMADAVLEFTFMRFKKILTHNWHWKDIGYNPEYDKFGVFLEGAPSGNSSHIPFFGLIAHLGGRPYGYLIDLDRNALKTSSMLPRFTIGFRNPGASSIRSCILELTRPVMMLAGPDQGCIAYAFDRNNQPLPLVQVSGLIHRDKLPKGSRVL